MPVIRILPHPDICPAGTQFEVAEGANLCRSMLANGVEIEHACELSCACTTCHVIVREGFESLAPSEDKEDDLLDMAWGLTPRSRLSCQAIVAGKDLTIEMPRYTINHAKE